MAKWILSSIFVGQGVASAQDSWQSGYTLVGEGFCRPSNCKVNTACRTNGFFKDRSTINECHSTCDSASGCVGFAFSQLTNVSSPNRCFVYTSTNTVPSGWTAYKHDYFDIGSASGFQGVQCYRKLTVSTTAAADHAASHDGHATADHNGHDAQTTTHAHATHGHTTTHAPATHGDATTHAHATHGHATTHAPATHADATTHAPATHGHATTHAPATHGHATTHAPATHGHATTHAAATHDSGDSDTGHGGAHGGGHGGDHGAATTAAPSAHGTHGTHGDGHTDPHTDSTHGDAHGGASHGDSHKNTTHGDAHGGSAHGGAHGNTTHGDTHGAGAHGDAHGGESHGDSHKNATHGDTHGDSNHTDSHGGAGHGEAHGGAAHSKIPDVYTVTAPHGPELCEGVYHRVAGQSPNGHPIWKHAMADRWIYMLSSGAWGIGGMEEKKKNFKTDLAYVFCGDHAGSHMPDETGCNGDHGKWQRWSKTAWAVDGDIKFTRPGGLPTTTKPPVIPSEIIVYSPNGPAECVGTYKSVGQKGHKVNGMPIWKHTKQPRWIYYMSNKKWGIGGPDAESKKFNSDSAFIFCDQDAKGKLPTELKCVWTRWNNKWIPDTKVTFRNPAAPKGNMTAVASSAVAEKAPAAILAVVFASLLQLRI